MSTIYRDVGFVHLHVHTSFSLLEGALTIAALTKLAPADRMPALAITDTNNLFGALEFSEKMAGYGVQPIIGIQLSIDFGDVAASVGRTNMAAEARGNLVLLATSERGYENLMRLSSRAFLETPSSDETHATLEQLAEGTEGIIALTGGPSGPLDKMLLAGNADLAKSRLASLRKLFGQNLYIEVQRHHLENERIVEPALLALAYEADLPLVGTNEACFAKPEDYEAHDALICIAEGALVSATERRQLSAEHWLKPRADMVKLFEDLPEAAANTVEIAMRCAYRPLLRKPILPSFTVGDGDATDEADELTRQAEEGLTARLRTRGVAPGLTEEIYRERLSFELGVIRRMKYPGYFLIVSDFIKWAKSKGIPVGPGRGSGAGSLVAFALTITDLDPLRFGLLFERFLNPERVSMPDFDIDFCQDRRDEVIRYVQERYGQDRVAQIITFGSLLARGVLRDVGRVLEMPYGQVDRLTKLVPQNPANPVTLEKAIAEEPRLQAEAAAEPIVQRLLDIARKLEGLYRHASTHAAGIVIGDRPLDQLVPLYRDPKSDMPVTQFNMKWVEPAGLVKFDFLGLKTLTVLQTAVNLIAQRGITVDLEAVPLDDEPTYAMLSRGEVVGIFQLESAGMRRALLEMKPDRFEDIIALVALYRPGPMANIPVYCARKHGTETPEYPHAAVEPSLKETFGVIVYQEQVMEIAKVLSGYSLGEADLLRRAMGKKIKAEMDAQRSRFVQGAVERKVAKAKADEIFDLLAKFADYGFNKSHAAAYALVSYQTAYLKAHYPVEFIAASMTLDMSNTEKLVEFRREAHRLGITVAAPSANRSTETFDVEDGAIIYSMAALKGVGTEAVKAIVAARAGGPFTSLTDFSRRINGRLVNKRVVETLASAGALDAIAPRRSAVFAGADMVVATANSAQSSREGGQSMLFGAADEGEIRLPSVNDWPQSERLQREFDAIGFFLSGHPLDEFSEGLAKLRIQTHAEFARAVRQGASAGRLAATVIDKQERRTKTGNRMGIIQLSDRSGQYESILFSESLAQYRDLLNPGSAVLLSVSAALDNDDLRLRIQTVEKLDTALARVQQGVRIFLRDLEPVAGVAARLQKRGEGEVAVIVMTEAGQSEVEIRLAGKFDLSGAVVGSIKAVPGVVSVQHV